MTASRSGTKANLAQMSLVISEEASRSFQAVDLVLRDTISQIDALRLDRAGMETAIGGREIYELLKAKAGGLPQVDNMIIVNASGSMANYLSILAGAADLTNRSCSIFDFLP